MVEIISVNPVLRLCLNISGSCSRAVVSLAGKDTEDNDKLTTFLPNGNEVAAVIISCPLLRLVSPARFEYSRQYGFSCAIIPRCPEDRYTPLLKIIK